MPNIATCKLGQSSLASTASRAPTTAAAAHSPPGGGAGGGVRFLAEHNEERTRHSIRSIDSGLGESDDPTQVDKDTVPEVCGKCNNECLWDVSIA